MKAKEKAVELVNKYLQVYDGRVLQAKKCALILVDEMLGYMGADRGYLFWEEVRKEIENL
jgi:hypothetical protein